MTAVGRVLVALALATAAAAAQQQVESGKPPIDLESWKQLLASAPSPGGFSAEYRAASERAALESLAVRTAWERLQLDYERRRLEQRAETFAWQQRSTELLFWLVTLVVLSGLGLSYWHVLRKESSPVKLVIGEKGIELNSRLVGVVIFVLSVAFFYLYLENVYPISEVAPQRAAASAAAEATHGDR